MSTMDEARRTESNQRRIASLKGDNGRSKAKKRSPDKHNKRINPNGKGYLSTPSPRHNKKQTYSNTGVMIKTSDMSLQMDAVIRTSEDDISSKASLHTCPNIKSADGNKILEFIQSSPYHVDMTSKKTSSGDIICKNTEIDAARNNNAVSPTTLSLEDYQRRGQKKRKAIPRSAIRESLNFEQQHFSRMNSAPHRSPHSGPKESDTGESSREAPHPPLVIGVNKTLHSKHSVSPNGRNVSKTISLKKENERIQKNIWNNPVSPLPKIGDHQPVVNGTTLTSIYLGKGSTGFESESDKYLMNEQLAPSFKNDFSLSNNKQSINSKAFLHNEMMKVPLVTDAVATKYPLEAGHLKDIPGNASLTGVSKVASLESKTRILPKPIPEVVMVDIRPGGLTYYLTVAHESKDIQYGLPSSLKMRLQERVKDIRGDLEVKSSLIKENLKKLELKRKRKCDAFEARHEAVRQRRKEMLNRRQLKTIFSRDLRQLRAKHNRGMVKQKMHGRLRLVFERRIIARARKKVMMDIKKVKCQVTSGDPEREQNMPKDDALDQDETVGKGCERVMRKKKEITDVVTADEAEGQGRHEEVDDDDESLNDGRKVKDLESDGYDGDDESLDDDGRQVIDSAYNDGRINESSGNDLHNLHTEDTRANHAGSKAHSKMEEDNNAADTPDQDISPADIIHQPEEDSADTIDQADEFNNSAVEPYLQLDLASAAQHLLGINQPPSEERHVVALSYYRASIRGTHEEVEDLSALRPDGSRVVYEDPIEAQGDYIEEEDDESDDDDDDDIDVVETTERENLEGVLVRRTENVGSRRCRQMTCRY